MRVLVGVAGVAGVAAVFAACGSNTTTNLPGDDLGCIPGAQIACACAGSAVTGVQVCSADGASFSACTGCQTSDDGGAAAPDQVAAITNAASLGTATNYWHGACGCEVRLLLLGDGSARYSSPNCSPGVAPTSLTWTKLSSDDFLLNSNAADAGLPNTLYSFHDVRGAVADARFTANVAVNTGTGQGCTFDLRDGVF